jgi:hypothetical protein
MDRWTGRTPLFLFEPVLPKASERMEAAEKAGRRARAYELKPPMGSRTDFLRQGAGINWSWAIRI